MFPESEMRSMNLKTFSKLFLTPDFSILINGLAAKLPHSMVKCSEFQNSSLEKTKAKAQIIWRNSLIRAENKPIYYRKWIKNGIMRIEDLQLKPARKILKL